MITQIDLKMEQKEQEIKRFQEDLNGLESRKGDKIVQLSKMIHNSIDKIEKMRKKQEEDKENFEESET